MYLKLTENIIPKNERLENFHYGQEQDNHRCYYSSLFCIIGSILKERKVKETRGVNCG